MFPYSRHLAAFMGNKFRLRLGYTPFLLILFTLLTLHSWTSSLVTAALPDHDEIRHLILTKDQNITYDLLQKYFEKEGGIASDKIVHSRLFPLCVQTSTLNGYTPLKHFAPIWEAMEKQGDCEERPLRFYEFDEKKHSMRHNKDWIESITFSRINTPEVDARNMRQWMHIKVKAKNKLMALYMQPIVGNIGLSTGEFSLEFGCSDFMVKPDPHLTAGMIFHCDYRSKAELNHPVAFFGGYKAMSPMDEFHVHYKFMDISCLETPFLQFILIAIKDFKMGDAKGPQWDVDFKPLLSPVFTNFDFDSQDGAITPYYIDWHDQMTCTKTSQDTAWTKSTKKYHDTDFAPLPWKETQLDRLFVNEDYEDCVTNAKTDTPDKDNNKECGPGPFECPKELSLKQVIEKTNFQAVVDRRKKEFDEAEKLKDCSPCVFPKEAEVMHKSCLGSMRRLQAAARNAQDPNIRRPEGLAGVATPLDPYLYLDYSEYLSATIDGRYHGALAILVYTVITPVGVLIGRFYRGTPMHHLHKDDYWIIVHSSIHLLGLHLLWISIGFVTTMDESQGHTAGGCYKQAEIIRYNTSNFEADWTQDDYIEWLDSCTYKTRKNTHAGLGIFNFVVHNLNVILSFFRSHTDYIRNIQVIVHSHLGYLDMIMSFITIIYAMEGQHCTEVLGYCICMICITVIIFWCASCIASSEDKKLGIDPPRYKWPILEPIRIAHSGEYYETKMGVLGVYAGLLVFVWVLSLVAVYRITTSENVALASFDPKEKPDDEENESVINGVFAACRIQNFYKPNFDDE